MLDDYQQFIHTSRYARYLPEEKRRETWCETVNRYIHNVVYPAVGTQDNASERLCLAILNMDVMPSMRALMTAGEALNRDNVCGYNCAYLPVDSPRSFDEAMYILMCGTGVGFSVEHQYVSQLPIISEHFEASNTTIVVGDSKSGWARAFRELLSLLYAGQVPAWDVSKVRPAGARLRTFGGRASGPGPLEDLFRYAITLFTGAAGRRLTSLECHDLLCQIGEIVVVGGVRRSALISLSDVYDERLRNAKTGSWWENQGQRSLANNSAVFTERPTVGGFLREWEALYSSHSGERGIFNREACRRHTEHFVLGQRRRSTDDFGTNPCCEIILRPFEFCNLTEVIVRPNDTLGDLRVKVELATILGTIQSTLTDFKYLRRIWKQNCEEERLLGVSFTGVLDHSELAYDFKMLTDLKTLAVEVNKVWADRLGISQSHAITCVKPSGTVSQLAGCSSGLHPAYSEFYLRSVRQDNKDPLTDFLKEQGVPYEPELLHPESTTVFYFPRRAPNSGAPTRNSFSATANLEIGKRLLEGWCEHKPSQTVYVREEEWLDVGAWVYRNFDDLAGTSFLPFDGGSYKQAPYQEITEEQYNEYKKAFPTIKWEDFQEDEDNTTASQELACIGGVCEL